MILFFFPSSGVDGVPPTGVATLQVRKGAFDALNKGSGALGSVKLSCRPLGGAPLKNSMFSRFSPQVVSLHGGASLKVQKTHFAARKKRVWREPRKLGAKKSTQTFFVQSFSTTLRVMDVRAETRGCPHQKVLFPAAPVVGRNFLTPGHSGVRVRNVRRKSGPKSLCLCCFFFPDK